MMQTQGRSARMERAYDRLSAEYGGPGTISAERFTAAGVYDKVGLLVILALVTGAIGYATASIGLFWLGLVGGLVFSLVGIFRPRTAPVMAPLYALAEGLALGALTAAYAVGSNGIAPLAIIFTGGVFLTALVIFRSGLVKVTPKFVSMTLMASVGFLLVLLGGWLGLFPGLNSQTGLLVFGIIGVVIGVAYLFIDFNYVEVGEQRGLPVEGEWYGALMLMMSLVFVYINVLRILASRRR
ncbi:MAG TPA: Bax inhibitor-1/YccA family protein [Acidimicrobiales bacterium]